MARPPTNILLEVASAQTNDPSSKTARKARKEALREKYVNTLPVSGCSDAFVIMYADAYQPTAALISILPVCVNRCSIR